MKGTEIIQFLSDNFPTVMGTINSITGALFTAIFLRSNTSATEFEKVKAGQFKELSDELLESGKMTYTEYYKAKNFLEVAKKADYYYQNNKEKVNCVGYDFDWLVRFYEAVGNISDAEMQDLWARILAGETAKPYPYSFKTIDTLRNMRKKDAELFVKICSHSFVNGTREYLLPNNDNYLKACNIEYADIMKLSEQGLIYNDSTIGLNIKVSAEPIIFVNNKEMIMCISSVDGKEELTCFSEYPFTEVGKELAFVIDKYGSDEDLIKYGKQVLLLSKNYKIEVHKIKSRMGDLIEFDRNNLLIIHVLLLINSDYYHNTIKKD